MIFIYIYINNLQQILTNINDNKNAYKSYLRIFFIEP
jgi:hypothetical protein